MVHLIQLLISVLTGYIYFGTPNGGSILSGRCKQMVSAFSVQTCCLQPVRFYGTVVVSPNQIFVVDYNGMPEFSGGGTHSGQIQIFQNGRIEIHVTSSNFNP